MRRAFAQVGSTRGQIASPSFQSVKINGRFKRSRPLSRSRLQYGPNSHMAEMVTRPTSFVGLKQASRQSASFLLSKLTFVSEAYRARKSTARLTSTRRSSRAVGAVSPSQRSFRSRLSAPSTPYLRSVGRPHHPTAIGAPNRNITKTESARSVGRRSAGPRRSSNKMRRAGIVGHPRQGIKITSSPAGNGGERARRRPSQRSSRARLAEPAVTIPGRHRCRRVAASVVFGGRRCVLRLPTTRSKRFIPRGSAQAAAKLKRNQPGRSAAAAPARAGRAGRADSDGIAPPSLPRARNSSESG
jgi:hypothetical protein